MMALDDKALELGSVVVPGSIEVEDNVVALDGLPEEGKI